MTHPPGFYWARTDDRLTEYDTLTLVTPEGAQEWRFATGEVLRLPSPVAIISRPLYTALVPPREVSDIEARNALKARRKKERRGIA